MWLLPAFSLLATAAGHIYYRLTVAGQRIPRKGPLLLVANHPNSVLDPILVCAAAHRPVRFLAKASLVTGAPWGWLMRGAGAIPVYRRIDDATLMDRNVAMFRAVYDALSEGAAIGIFPEGISHSEPSLASLKTGAARIALGAVPKCRGVFPVIPAGLVLRQKDVFRSEALVVLGEPVAWDDLVPCGQEDQEAVREFTSRIDAGLRHVTLNLERWEDKPLIECAEKIWAAEWGADRDPTHRVQRLGVTTRTLAQLRREPERQWTSLVRDVAAHCNRLRRLGLRPTNLGADVRAQAAIRWAARRFYLVGPPAALLAAAGYLLFLVPYRLTGIVDRFDRIPEYNRSTYKLFAGIVLYTVWVLLLAGAAGWLWGPAGGVGALVAIPLVGLVGLWIRERWGSARRGVRRFLLLRSRRRLIERLRERQRELALRLKDLYAARVGHVPRQP